MNLLFQSDSEFERLYLPKFTGKQTNNCTEYYKSSPALSDHPASIDWRTKGAVSDIKNQVGRVLFAHLPQMCIYNIIDTVLYNFCFMRKGQCGASYAFSAVGALEGAWALAHGKLTLLSEQNIIDCSGEPTASYQFNIHSLCSTVSYGNHGCHGGNMHNAYQYIIANDGVTTESSYPFVGKVMCLLMIGASHEWCDALCVSSNRLVGLQRGRWGLGCQDQWPSSLGTRLGYKLPWLAWDQLQWPWMAGTRPSG